MLGGDLYITGNPALRSLSGLSNLVQVAGDLRISNNPGLCQGEVEALLSQVEVGGEVRALNNDGTC